MKKIELSFEQYSHEQKFDLVERLWNNLLQNEDELISPDWHKPILEERMAKIKSGQVKTYPWSEVKKEIERDILCK